MPLDSLSIADTLPADTLATDSLPVIAPPVQPGDPLFVGSEVVFGPGSILADQAAGWQAEIQHEKPPLADNIAVKGGVLLLLMFYCLVVTLFGSQLRGLAGVVAGRKWTNRLLDQQGNLAQNFINSALWMGIPTLVLIVIRTVDALGAPVPEVASHAVAASLTVAILTLAALLPVLAYSWAVIRIAGKTTGRTAFAQRLQMLRRIIGALASIALTPPAMFWAVSGGKTGEILAFIVAGIAACMAFLLIVRTFQLFSEQRVSFLYWILYLCAVEIFPVSFVVLIAIR